MLLLISKKSNILKETSSKLLKIIQASKTVHLSAVGKFEEDSEFDGPFRRRENQRYPRKFEEDSEFDGSFRRRENQRFPRKFGSGSSYNKNSRFNYDFEPRKNAGYRSSRPKKIWDDYDTASQSENGKTPVLAEKFFYVEHPDVTERADDEVDSYRKKISISTRGNNVPKPITKFSELCLPENLMNALNEENYLEPSPIQCQGWPIALSGRDMIGVSRTGSGKTLAYMLPAVVHAANQKQNNTGGCKPQILVLGPTRELIQQIHNVSNKFIQSCGLSGASVYGGASKNFQLSCLEGSEICIATPGRLIDFLSCGDASLDNCTYLVLDEADRMLDMGFEPQIRDIVDQIRPDRQTLMWSATWPTEIRNLAEDFLTDFIHVTIGSGDLVPNPNIEQKIYVVDEDEKEERFFSLLESLLKDGKTKVLVFAQTKRMVDHLDRVLNRNGIRSLGIHGDNSQRRRDDVLNKFRKDKSSVLVATDVAARGLDISDVQHVVNFDFPPTIADYIHRIGRTARGSASGFSHSFFTGENAGLVKELISVLKKSNQEVNTDLHSLVEMGRKPSMKYGNYKPHNRRVHRYM